MDSGDDPAYWQPPDAVLSMDQNAPNSLCGTLVQTLTSPGTVAGIAEVNPRFKGMPDGSALPVTTSLMSGGTSAPQDPQNAPTTVVSFPS
jgi:hypothetical protein